MPLPSIPEGRIRRMRQEDLCTILAIEAVSDPSPWPDTMFIESMLWPQNRCEVFDVKGDIAGYLIISTVIDEADVLSVVVAPQWRRKGLARYMLENAFARLQRDEVERLFLEVRVSNTPAQQLYEQLGFVEVGRRKNYYQSADGPEDAIVMCKEFAE
ncbi:MAG TPA: ribosomal protein S18-alanine N-acetyltransferase [Alcanivoracaceae bacterium]|nr:ribosomal protein S18-alanine N-acetyltransferase [Alcanivoracaceae bacterium]